MIEIRPDQLRMFRDHDFAVFVRRAATYLRETHRAALDDMAEIDLQDFIRRAAAVAHGNGLTSEAAVVQFLELSLAFGEDFHQDVRYPAASAILATQREESVKMRELLAAAGEGFAART